MGIFLFFSRYTANVLISDLVVFSEKAPTTQDTATDGTSAGRRSLNFTVGYQYLQVIMEKIDRVDTITVAKNSKILARVI